MTWNALLQAMRHLRNYRWNCPNWTDKMFRDSVHIVVEQWCDWVLRHDKRRPG